MMVRHMTRWLRIGASIALLCHFGVAQETARSGTMSLDSIVEAVEQAQIGVRSQVSYQVIREYHLFGKDDSSANSDVVAEVDFTPPASKDYRIQKSSGSARGRQVVRRVLDHGPCRGLAMKAPASRRGRWLDLALLGLVLAFVAVIRIRLLAVPLERAM